MRSALVLVVTLASTACVPSEGPLMSPNQDCLGCHGRGEGRAWTVAGTMGGKGSRIVITDANGWSFTLHAAENGNFYTAEKVAFPITVSVDGRLMTKEATPQEPIPVKYGGCNMCHGPGGVLLALDEFMAPGQDCLACHDGSVAEKVFSVAGTWRGPGHTITVTGRNGTFSRTTNRVGNFFIEADVGLPGTARVDTQTMEPALDYGGCNRCHGNGGEAGD